MAGRISIKITGLSPEDAEKLFWAINSGELEELGFPEATCEYIVPEEDGKTAQTEG